MYKTILVGIQIGLIVGGMSVASLGATPQEVSPPAIAPFASQVPSVVSSSPLESSLHELHAWLDASPHGANWRKYLRSAELEAELAKGRAANRVIVGDILARYQSQKPGMHERQFEQVRVALSAFHAQGVVGTFDGLPALIQEGKNAFVPVTEAAVQQARSQLVMATAQLQNMLSSHPAHQSGWNTYLHWPELTGQLADGAKTDPVLLASLRDRFCRDETGLEMRPFVAVRDALAKYAGLAAAAADPQLNATYQTRLDELAKQIEAYRTSPTSAHRDAIGNQLGWLTRSSQSPTLVGNVRRHFSRPNLFMSVSGNFLTPAMEEGVDRTEPVTDNILGTSIQGTVHTTGYRKLVLVPCATKAQLQVQLIATAHSNNTGWNRGVTLCTTGTTSIWGCKDLYFDSHGLTCGGASASCSTRTQINDIIANRRIVERIASKRAGKSKGQAEAIASDHAEQRVVSRMNQEASEKAAEANARYHEKFRAHLERMGEFPEQMNMSTTSQAVYLHVLKSGPDMLAASDSPRPLAGSSHDVAAQIHESLIGNYAAGLVGGRTWSKYKLEQDAEKASGKKSTEAYDYDWEMTFANRERRPVSVEFRDGEFDITVRVQKFLRDNEPGDRPASEPIPADKAGIVSIDALLEIGATYTVELTPTGPLLKRKDRVRVDEPEGKLKGLQVAKKGAVKATFEDRFFKEEIRPQGIPLNQGKWAGQGKLVARELNSYPGWINIGWHWTPHSASPQVAAQ